MTFDEVLDQIRELLQQRGRVTYRSLKRRFDLNDEYLEDLKGELIRAEGVAADEDGDVLVWIGDGINGEQAKRGKGEERLESSVRSPVSEEQGRAVPVQTLDARRQTLDSAAERRQLTVMFCDLVGSTALSAQLDPEELREVVRAYQETCTDVVRRYDGHIAQHLGDGLLVYFSYPIAHEDDAQRAVRAGLEIIAALQKQVPSPLVGEGQGEGAKRSVIHTPHPNLLPQGEKELRRLQVRIGIHTGLVVIGDIGSSEKREILALGETPNIAARLQSLAEPDTVVISAATQRLVTGLFESQDLGPQTLKGISIPLSVYQAIGESTTQSRFEVAVQAGLTPLVGREEELALLRRCWHQAQGGAGQVVLLSGEPGIGKSRLVQELKDHVAQDGAVRIEYHCSPYHQNSAFYPLIEHLQRVLQFTTGDTPQAKLHKLEQTLARYRFPQNDTVPLLAALLSLPLPEGSPPLSLTPQQQKQKTLDTLVRWLFEETERVPVYAVWEDLHWADPSTLEFLTVCLDQTPTARMLMVLTFRPEFTPTWASRSHVGQLVLNRLGRQQSSAIVEGVTGGKPLPQEVVQQIANKTDGVPLFVEELTKMVVESGLVREVEGRYELNGPLPPLAIPSTLHDSLMARLDRLASVREIAQMGATLGREFSYELLQAVSPLTEESLQRGLKQLVEAELVYQSGLPPQARYLFKHALVQDTAYQSLLKSRRQQLHQQVARVLEEKFPQTVETHPELVAHHYTEAGLIERAIPYWQQAGQRASQRSAHAEAVNHFTKGVELLKILPETLDRTQQELTLQAALGSALVVTKGLGAPEVRDAYDCARHLCRQLGDTPQLFPTLHGLASYYIQQEEMLTAIELDQQCLSLAEREQDTGRILVAHRLLTGSRFFHGEPSQAYEHCEQGMALYDFAQPGSLAFVYGIDPGLSCLSIGAWALWYLGYPDQALKRTQTALALAREVNHPYTLAWAFNAASWLRWYRREGQAACTLADEAIALATLHEFPHWIAMGLEMRGQALVLLGQWEEGTRQLQQGIEAYRATGAVLCTRGSCLAELARGYGSQGQVEKGLQMLAEALAVTNETDVRHYEAEMYRLKGELMLAQSRVQGLASSVQKEAEESFLKAIEVARRQQAKSWELRASISLARLWQQQSKQKEAHDLLAEVYHWFTEGFDTKDLQEAKALLEELSH